MTTPLLHGVCAAMTSPFDDTGEHLDEGRLRDHIESLIDAGVHGLVLCAGTGEFAFLSDDEKDRIISLGCEIVDGRIPVVAQTSAITTTDAIERTRRAADHGAAAAMVLPPYFEGPFERGVLFHYEKLAKAIDIPIVLYNIPVNSGFDIHPDLYRQLMAMENIDYIKDSTGDLIRLQKLIGIGGHVLAGADPLAPYAAMSGAAGWIWGAANVMPHECVHSGTWCSPVITLVLSGSGADAPRGTCSSGEQCRRRVQLRSQDGHEHGRRAVGPCRRPVMPMTRQGRVALQTALSTLPINGTNRDTLVFREWDDEKDWLVQMTHNSGVSRATNSGRAGGK